MNCFCLSVAVLLVTSTCQDHCADEVHHEVNFLQSQKHLALSTATTGKGPAPLIPSKLTFNHWYNLLEGPDCLEKRSVLNVIEMNPSMEVLFYNDTQCREAIVRVHSEELANYFDTEPEGFFKSDTCRVAMLIENGGYYYDSDFDLVKNVQPFIPASASLVTATAGEPTGNQVHQGFLASVSGHPVLYDSLNYHLEFYKFNEEKGLHGIARRFPSKYDQLLGLHGGFGAVLLGPMSLGMALMKWGGVERLPTGRLPGPGATDLAYLFNHTLPEEGINEIYGYTWRGCDSELAGPPTNKFIQPLSDKLAGKHLIYYCNVGLVDVEQKELLAWTRNLGECCD